MVKESSDHLPWTPRERIIMLLVAFFVCITMSGAFVGHIGKTIALLRISHLYSTSRSLAPLQEYLLVHPRAHGK